MKYIKRNLEERITTLFDVFPVLTITGPRQSGKSTLIKHYIENSKEDWIYYSLDNREQLAKIKNDPTLFVKSFKANIALDEIQKAPELFHAIKEFVDSDPKFKIILSGSANFLLLKTITESLAGRVGILELLPFSFSEWLELKSNKLIEKIIAHRNIDSLFDLLLKIKRNHVSYDKLFKFIISGGYPKISFIKQELQWDWFQSYITTYIERDLRDFAQIANLDAFQTVYKAVGFQTGNILNLQNLSSDTGISTKTIKQYISILEASYQCKSLPAYYSNTRKQLIKRPKVFYLDTGIINYFYQNKNVDEMINRGNWGAILETFVYLEVLKEVKDISYKPSLHFWRTNSGAEVDFIINTNKYLYPIEVKAGIKIESLSIRGLKSFLDAEKNKCPFGIIFYRGEEFYLPDEKIIAIPLNMLF